MKRTSLTFILILFIITAFAQLEKGDQAPDFSARDDQNHLWKSSDYIGKKFIIVYFYPAAMTGGCTKQACAFRDNMSKLNDLDGVVVGVSGDKVENLKYFKMAENLNFPLLSDETGSIAKKFGVPIRDGGSIVRNIDGKDVTLVRGVTTSRWTFVIGKDGKIVYVNTKVNPEKDSENVMEVIKNLR